MLAQNVNKTDQNAESEAQRVPANDDQKAKPAIKDLVPVIQCSKPVLPKQRNSNPPMSTINGCPKNDIINSEDVKSPNKNKSINSRVIKSPNLSKSSLDHRELSVSINQGFEPVIFHPGRKPFYVTKENHSALGSMLGSPLAENTKEGPLLYVSPYFEIYFALIF